MSATETVESACAMLTELANLVVELRAERDGLKEQIDELRDLVMHHENERGRLAKVYEAAMAMVNQVDTSSEGDRVSLDALRAAIAAADSSPVYTKPSTINQGEGDASTRSVSGAHVDGRGQREGSDDCEQLQRPTAVAGADMRPRGTRDVVGSHEARGSGVLRQEGNGQGEQREAVAATPKYSEPQSADKRAAPLANSGGAEKSGEDYSEKYSKPSATPPPEERCECGARTLYEGPRSEVHAVTGPDLVTHSRERCWPAREDALKKLETVMTMAQDMWDWFGPLGGLDIAPRSATTSTPIKHNPDADGVEVLCYCDACRPAPTSPPETREARRIVTTQALPTLTLNREGMAAIGMLPRERACRPVPGAPGGYISPDRLQVTNPVTKSGSNSATPPVEPLKVLPGIKRWGFPDEATVKRQRERLKRGPVDPSDYPDDPDVEAATPPVEKGPTRDDALVRRAQLRGCPVCGGETQSEYDAEMCGENECRRLCEEHHREFVGWREARRMEAIRPFTYEAWRRTAK